MGLCKLCPVGLVLAWSAVPRLSGKCCRPVAWLVSSLGVAHPGCAYGMSLHPLLLPCSTHTLLQPLLQLSGAGWLWQGPYGAAKELVWSSLLLGAASCRDSPPRAAALAHSCGMQSGGSACALLDSSLNMDTATPAPKHGHSSFCLSLSWSGTV